jgi:heme-degrading monooxygenase HmoA
MPAASGPAMVTIGMNYRVLEGKDQVFEAAFRRVLEAMREIPGHDDSRLYREVGSSPPGYLIVSRWNSQKDFQDFIRSEQFTKVTDWGSEHILAAPPRHTTYHEGS